MTVENHVETGLGAGPRFSDYVRIARPDHWIKNIFMLPGAALAIALSGELGVGTVLAVAAALASLCLIASANYTINEYLDAQHDRHHPLKKSRPGAEGRLEFRLVALQYLLLAAAGMLIAQLLGTPFMLTGAALLLMGLAYNVPPVRTKDRVYLDVLSESVNNPLRLLMGWFVVLPDALPPASLILAYWMGGAFLMAMKRYSEYRRIGDPGRAGLYRRSFRFYTEEKLLLSSFFYALLAAFLLGVFLVKYRIEYLLTLPLFAVLFTWYLAIALRADSAAQAPEKLHRERSFMAFVGVLSVAVAVLTFVDLPFLNFLMDPYLLRFRG
ncbi:UbiA family prenyltransferase [Falsiroseomonas oryzae]|uniref:UbiA family prenyltransferase n=1 Tax=Falsiroseomonas oryzae TaxID=2766473 RepID=UPI0022EB4970|nr:UbiA family prenyltransferase [Roseomonas sp. MO-31]